VDIADALLSLCNTASITLLYVENVGKETILKVTDWLRGIWEMRRRTGGPVQRWIDSIPLPPAKSDVAVASECQEDGSSKPTPTEPKDILFRKESKPPNMTASAPVNVPNSPAINAPIFSRYQRYIPDANLAPSLQSHVKSRVSGL